MQVNKKSLLAGFVLLTAVILIHGCTSSSSSSSPSSPSPSSVSGKLTVGVYGSETVEKVSTLTVQPLTIPKNLIIDRESPDGSEPDFVPDEIIVKYRPGLNPAAAATTVSAGGYSVLKNAGSPSRGSRSLLKLASSERALLSDSTLRERTLYEIERLKSLPSVEYAQPNYIYKPLFVPNDEFYYLQWQYPLIKLDQVWDENNGLVNDVSGITVAVLDTGIARSDGTINGNNHPDLGTTGVQIIYEYDFISDTDYSLDQDGIDPDATDPGDDPEGQASTFHGTHVAGTIGALTNNYVGVAGVAGGNDSGVRIMPVRVLGSGGGITWDIAEAIKYAAGLVNDSGTTPTQKADIINMSLGSPTQDRYLEDAVNDAYAQGVLIVAAAGNDGTTVPYYPAAYDKVISVTAVDIGAEIAPYSSYGDTVDIAAPGGSFTFDLNFDDYIDGILSTLVEQFWMYDSWYYEMDVYAFYQGTSMAAPHVAGVAALVKQALIGRGANSLPDDIKSILIGSAIDLGDPGQDDLYGHGLVNAYAAVKLALGETENPVLFPFKKEYQLEGLNPSADLVLKNIGGGGAITVSSITKKNSAGWLTVSTQSGTADSSSGLSVTVSIDTDSYPEIVDGRTYTEMLEIQSDAGTEYVYIIYNSGGIPSPESGDIGEVYVVAIDPILYEVVKMDIVTYEDAYEYTIADLEPGSYVIGASTDRDNDDVIFELGDAYGYYTDMENQVILVLEAGDELTNIDFHVIDTAM